MGGYKEQIRAFLRRKKRISPAKRIVTEFFLNHPEDVAFLTLQDIALKTGVSPSTISRTAIEMGFDGYPGLQEKIRFEVKVGITPVERLKETASDTTLPIWEQSICKDVESLQALRTINQAGKFEEAVELFATSPNIYAFSLRSSYPLSFLFTLLLFQIRPNVRLIVLDDGMLAESMFDMRQGDTCLLVSFPRYTKVVLSAAERIRAIGCRIVSITDSELSPLAILSDIVFSCPYESVSFFNSNVCAQALLNALISGVRVRLGEEAIHRLEKHSSALKNQKLLLRGC